MFLSDSYLIDRYVLVMYAFKDVIWSTTIVLGKCGLRFMTFIKGLYVLFCLNDAQMTVYCTWKVYCTYESVLRRWKCIPQMKVYCVCTNKIVYSKSESVLHRWKHTAQIKSVRHRWKCTAKMKVNAQMKMYFTNESVLHKWKCTSQVKVYCTNKSVLYK